MLAHIHHETIVRCDGFPRGREVVVAQVELLAGLPYDPAQGRIVNVADAREEVMLDLVVEPANHPGDDRVTGCEVGRCLDLMDGPFVFNTDRIYAGSFKLGMFHDMRQLEHQGEGEAQGEL